jgi:protein-tyrosine kinase
MREVDRALERLYGANRPHEPGRETPPRPHVPLPSRPESPATRPVWPPTVVALERDHGERFQTLADRVLPQSVPRASRVVLFTSCQRAEGRSTLVLTLARVLGHRPGKTLLIDADLTGPSLGRWLGLNPRLGLEDVVASRCTLADAVVTSLGDSLHVLPLRAAIDRPRDFLASPGWSLLMARARRAYAGVLLDGSPLFAGLSAALLHRSVDAAVLVVHRARTTEASILRAREVLEAGGVPLLGLAETFAGSVTPDPSAATAGHVGR